MSRSHRGWYHPRNLPHLDIAGMTHAISFRLADSLPSEALDRLADEVKELPMKHRRRYRRQWIEAALDLGRGRCLLRQDVCAKIIQDALGFFHDQRYFLHAWVIMPNHIHALATLLGKWSLEKIIKSWKAYSASMINRHVCGGGRVWQRDYWDRYIRDEAHFFSEVEYIEDNPVKAGFVKTSTEWPWSSASHRMGEAV